jgi:hypothetical protein
MIQIIHTPTIKFEIDGEECTVRCMHFHNDGISPFTALENYLKKYEEAGYIKCYLYNMWTQHEPNGIVLLWIRYKCVK